MDVAYSSRNRAIYPAVTRWQFGGARTNSLGLIVPGGFSGVTTIPAASAGKHYVSLIVK